MIIDLSAEELDDSLEVRQKLCSQDVNLKMNTHWVEEKVIVKRTWAGTQCTMYEAEAQIFTRMNSEFVEMTVPEL